MLGICKEISIISIDSDKGDDRQWIYEGPA